MFSCQERIQNFFQGGGTNFRHFSSAVFFDRFNFKLLKYQKLSRGSGGMLPRKIFENLHTVIAILVIFEQFLRKVCHIFGL